MKNPLLQHLQIAILIVITLACPVWCPMAACVGAEREEAAPAKECCQRCSQPAEQKTSEGAPVSRTTPEDDASPVSRQCFCSDAFLAKMERDPDQTAHGHLTTIDIAAVDLAIPPVQLLQPVEQPRYCLSGREVRCLHMSLRC